jgi:hypothetical protein
VGAHVCGRGSPQTARLGFRSLRVGAHSAIADVGCGNDDLKVDAARPSSLDLLWGHGCTPPGRQRSPSNEDDNLAAMRARLKAESKWSNERGIVLDTGVDYRVGEPVRIRLRRRGHRVHLDDRGDAVRLAGRATGWFDVVDRAIADDGFNVNRRGVVFVAVGRDRDLAPLVLRLAESSLGVYLLLLELQDNLGSRTVGFHQ